MSFLESIFYMAWRGLAIGLIISAPMGPVGMLCIQRTLDKGRRAGLFTGIGAAISDFFYCLLTGFGLSFIEEFLEKNSNVIQLFGSAVLIGFGIYLFKKNPSKSLKKPTEDGVSVKKSILGGFLFTFSNPLILFLTIGLFARFNFLLPEFKVYQYLTGFVFIFIGAVLWWWVITFTVDKVRSHFNIRSMWLINKLIGVVILLFAVVGIITATSALVKAEDTKCWNTKRGFSGFSPKWTHWASPETGLIDNTSDSIITLQTPTENPDFMEFRFKAKIRKFSNKYFWGIIISDSSGSVNSDNNIIFDIQPAEGKFDGVSSAAALKITTFLRGDETSTTLISDDSNIFTKIKKGILGPDPAGASNFYKLVKNGRTLSLYGGIHTPVLISEMELPSDFQTDSVGFLLAPGASVEFSEIKLLTDSYRGVKLIWDDSELLREYLSNSRDRMEGYWRILDRSLEETLLKPGGNYYVASVKSGNGYDLIYLSGATVNSSAWTQGMIKGKLTPSGISGVWNVEWRDAMHRPLSHEVKAQIDKDGVLTVQFPYQNSQIRLIMVE